MGKLFVMNILSTSIESVINSTEFRRDYKETVRSKGWFRNILSGLSYLHKLEMCHLDVKRDNILIDKEDNAVICDFSGLNYSKKKTNRLVVKKKTYF